VGSCSDLFTVLLFCLYFLAILVCIFACDLCCFIVNVYSVESFVELMLYCFIMCRIKIKFSYLILSIHVIKEEFEDTKVVIIIRNSKKERQHNVQKKTDKRTNYDLISTTHTTKD
jgi:uncharacterized membrane-anchored protein YitT (DUF2179 family)